MILHALVLIVVLFRCDAGPPGPSTGGSTATQGWDSYSGTECSSSSFSDSPKCTSWIMSTGMRSDNIDAFVSSNGGALYDVEAVYIRSSGDVMAVYTSGIPSYNITITSDILDLLTGRQNAETDFVGSSGIPSIEVGDIVQFGDSIGYSSSGCTMGYWPPGPECPEDIATIYKIPLTPEDLHQNTRCEPGLGAIGLWVNGYHIFGWSDGFYYNDANEVWQNLAPVLEINDVDICGGHAAMGYYHAHGYSETCLAPLVGDDGTAHSPIIAWMADGYPMHGKYHANGVKSESCYVARNYSDSSDPYGCGGTGERTCVMVDMYDKLKGVTAAEHDGPDVTEMITSLSSNLFQAESGMYYQDYYYDDECTEVGNHKLDKYNGHEHGSYGYHYHASDSFPFMAGPILKASPDSTFFSCSDDGTDAPTIAPTAAPTVFVSSSPTVMPTTSPTAPTSAPTQTPSVSPTVAPTDSPTTMPTASPTVAATGCEVTVTTNTEVATSVDWNIFQVDGTSAVASGSVPGTNTFELDQDVDYVLKLSATTPYEGNMSIAVTGHLTRTGTFTSDMEFLAETAVLSCDGVTFSSGSAGSDSAFTAQVMLATFVVIVLSLLK